MSPSLRRTEFLAVALSAAGILMITMGIRQSFGLLVNPISRDTGVGIAAISFALAVGQFAWGAVQPVAGAIADRYGPRPVLLWGVATLATGCALTAYSKTGMELVVSLGLLACIGSGAGSFSVLIGAAAQRLPAESRAMASGIINAGGSLGQFVFAPVLQLLIQTSNWMIAIGAMSAVALAALPLIGRLTATTAAPAVAVAANPGSLRQAVLDSLKDPSYLLLHAGFFTCGFHIAFLVTHLPTEIDLCGLPASVASVSLAIIGLSNVAGSLLAGAAIARWRSKWVLALMYGSRALLVLAYLLMPRTVATYYLFAAGLGLTWLATVPPTASLVGKLFGTRYLATLFGLTLLSHQVGGFLGAWLGGVALTKTGNYTWMWIADIALASLAAIANLPIREARVARLVPQPA